MSQMSQISPPLASSADSGFVTVTLCSGRDLMGKNSGGSSDPFCIVEIESQVHFSKVKKETCNPVWNETYTFNTPSRLPSPFFLRISVWNQPKFSNGRDTKGAFLGQLHIDLGQVGRAEANGRFFELEKRTARSNVSGSLEIKIVITSEEDASRLKQLEKDRARAVQQAMQKQKHDEKNARAVEVSRQAAAEKERVPVNNNPIVLQSQDDFLVALAPSNSKPVVLVGDDDGVSAEELAVQKLRQLQLMSREKASIAAIQRSQPGAHQARASEFSSLDRHSAIYRGEEESKCCSCFTKKAPNLT